MNHEILDKRGRLLEPYLPAIYFDSSVLIDYWISEYMEIPNDDIEFEMISKPEVYLLRELFLKDKRIKETFKIRNKIISGNSRLTPVVSPLSLIELMEWNVEASFKEIASESLGSMFIQKKSKKEIGNYIRKLMNNANDNLTSEIWRQESKDWKIEGLKRLIATFALNRSFVNHHGLLGLLQVDIKNFNFTMDNAWQEPSEYAYLQIGAADTLHILFAEHLGCKYFATYDSDFIRAKNEIKEKKGITVLSNPQEIMNKIKK